MTLTTPDERPSDEPHDPDDTPTGEPRALSSAWLFGRRREVVILHRGQEYRLRITRADKLILTK